ncbi:MAG TPA: bifunctional [glutamate--ammonia ligase]-adenylyl-L-tyrosine phosphorylase/[glutamate--ammonia-ligase] adenylyltransferase, partial [Burkholderiales bacterium]|nr:bifunctional [glutamate--ammonia ligase]-adenylyl-L-tyrosine phosphorylase/[glutamate--ammonia-ligase] adenylyltransferase [Burkholderiales bacterium]
TIVRPFDRAEMERFLDAAEIRDECSLKHTLRDLRRQVMLRVMVRDLGEFATLDEVLDSVSALADVTLRCAVRHLDAWQSAQDGTPHGAESGRPQQLHVIAMGKLGGSELNVSSDIDLVFAYPEDGETNGSRPLSNHEYFTRLGRKVIGALSEITADGHVFRVDMRLRPYGDSGSLVSSFDMLEQYFVAQGREWERYAWIKARVVCGNREPEITQLVQPFVYRRHLDFSAINSLRELHLQIRGEVERRDMRDDIKLGRGGIREIEFIVQLFQLIRGGHDPALRTPSTRIALDRLAAHGVLAPGVVTELRDAYRFLRNLEHRLQYLDDCQTQSLPDAAADRECIAEAMQFASYDAFVTELERHRECVTRHFREIFDAQQEAQHPLAELWQPHADPQAGQAQLARLGFRTPAETWQQLRSLRDGSHYRRIAASGKARLDHLMPQLVATAARQPNPDATAARMLQIIESVSRRESYLALLGEYPQALERLATLAGASPWVAQYLAQYPILLDELLDPHTLYAAPDWPRLRVLLTEQLQQADGDTERQMDVLRHFKHSQTLRLIAQDLSGTLTLETLSDHLSDLACLLLDQVLALAWHDLRTRHRDAPRFAIVGYGKLGGKELGYSSDLDLIFLYDDDAPEAPPVYARLAQRINHWLNSMTAAGVLYETDLRLRPDGVAGLLVSNFAAFRDYQQHKAWLWEHQAVSRARGVAGDAALKEMFESIRGAVLRQPRDRDRLRGEIRAMRDKMLAAHAADRALFDVKQDRGGIIDVEFIVQYLVLGFACDHPGLAGNIGNLALLKLAAGLDLIPQTLAGHAHDAYRRFRRIQHSEGLQGKKIARIPFTEVREDAEAVKALWETVFEKSTED